MFERPIFGLFGRSVRIFPIRLCQACTSAPVGRAAFAPHLLLLKTELHCQSILFVSYPRFLANSIFAPQTRQSPDREIGCNIGTSYFAFRVIYFGLAPSYPSVEHLSSGLFYSVSCPSSYPYRAYPAFLATSEESAPSASVASIYPLMEEWPQRMTNVMTPHLRM